ncbi:MAG: DUF5615 family PIN-like protein [Acidobacteria bacterium]|nr:DUF5615 family PIN-like protein [Acidobacteriota bacterium]
MKFLIDMPLSPDLATWLAQQGHEAVHAFDLGLGRASDEAILERARMEERVIVTADLDYPRLLALTRAEGPGLILFRGGDYSGSDAVDRLRATFDRIPNEELPNSVVVIERRRIRRRWLPIEPGR